MRVIMVINKYIMMCVVFMCVYMSVFSVYVSLL